MILTCRFSGSRNVVSGRGRRTRIAGLDARARRRWDAAGDGAAERHV